MTTAREMECVQAAHRLHRFMAEHHLAEGVLVGPDIGVRLNYRVGRFVKSYLRIVPWRDEHCYLQAQGYWTLANWRLAELDPAAGFEDLAISCSDGIIARQRSDGAWEYPNPEWRGRVANAEGTWAAIGLVETFRRTGDERYLDAARRWHAFLVEHIGWRPAPGGEAANYFGDRPAPAVPNNSAFVLRLLAELADATGDDRFLDHAEGMLSFIETVQRPSGELPYQVASAGEAPVRLEHFQCYQYNAFEALDLTRFEQLSNDGRATRIVSDIERFLCAGVTPQGTIPFACDTPHPQVTYHLAAVTAALAAGARRQADGCARACAATRGRLLGIQRDDGSFPHSRRDYRILSDSRAYPRHLAMLLLHLLEIDSS